MSSTPSNVTFLSNRSNSVQTFILPENGVTLANFYRNYLSETYDSNKVVVKRGAEVLSSTSMVFNGVPLSEVPKKQDAARR
jgi:hypothetical protein